MTLTAGFRCTDGFIIAADMEISLGAVNVQGHKLLMSRIDEPFTFCIAIAGDMSYGLAAAQRVREAIRQLSLPSFANAKQSIRETLAEFYEHHMRHNWRAMGLDPPGFDLIIGFEWRAPESAHSRDTFGVVATDNEVVYDVEDIVFCGSGNEAAAIAAERLFDNRIHPTAVTQH